MEDISDTLLMCSAVSYLTFIIRRGNSLAPSLRMSYNARAVLRPIRTI